MRNKLIAILLLVSPLAMANSQQSNESWIGLIPALVAIVLSVLTKRVFLSLVASVVIGSLLVWGEGPSYGSALAALTQPFKYVYSSIIDVGHLSVIAFSLMISGSVAVLRKSGSMSAIALYLTRYAKTKRSALFTTYFMGIVVFFDDYANTMVVGNTMKNIIDKYKISREKLAYIVDATAAPIACVALISTWIGYEVGLIDDGLKSNGLQGEYPSAYAVFLNSLTFCFYPIITLVFVGLIIGMKRDFGPMLQYEKEASLKEVTEEKAVSGEMKGAWKTIVSIFTLITITFLGIYLTGEGDSVADRIQSGDCYKGLIWGSGSSLMLSLVFNLSSLGLKGGGKSVMEGVKELLPAIAVLVLAWSLNLVLSDLKLGEYLANLVRESGISISWIPGIVFLVSGGIAFSTGSSFSTMSIMYPLVLGILATTEGGGSVYLEPVLFGAVASVLSGAVLGDHCSPISDTTILSSMSAGCDHINHVNSQLPYALVVGLISLVLIILSTVFNVSSVLLIVLSIPLIYLIIKLLGRTV